MSVYSSFVQGNERSRVGCIPIEPSSRDLYEGLLPSILYSIERPEAGSYRSDINHVRCIGSYDWIDDAKPTIVVPGSPPIWKPISWPFRVPRDQNNCLINDDGHRLPSCDLLPLFRAVDVVSENGVDWSAVDFVTNRNGLRKLLRWIDGRGDSDRFREFRLDLQLAGRRTVLMNRWEKTTLAPPATGYGFGFEKATTVPVLGCENSTGHHRIIQYDFGGLNMVVRFEVDACIGGPPQTTTYSGSLHNDVSSQHGGFSSSPMSNTGFGADVNIIRAGQLVSQSSIVELTTRSERNVICYDWKEQYPQLYLSQTPHHFLAVHHGGLFDRMEMRQLDDAEMKTIHASVENSFKKLRALLETIQQIAVDHGKEARRLSLVCRNGSVTVHERRSRDNCLPDAVMGRFQ